MVILAMDPVRDWMTKSDETLALPQSLFFDAFGFIVLCLRNRWKVLGGTLIGRIAWIAHNSFSIVMWLMTAWMAWVVILERLPRLAVTLRRCGELLLSCWEIQLVDLWLCNLRWLRGRRNGLGQLFCDFDGRWDLLSIIIASCTTCYQVPCKNGYDQVYMDGNHCIIVNTGRASDLVFNNQVINTALLW